MPCPKMSLRKQDINFKAIRVPDSKTMITKNLLALSLFLLGTSIHTLIGLNRTSADLPKNIIFSRLHTLSIHIKDPAVHDSVFHFLKDKLQLPVYYSPVTLGTRKYAGIFAGNLVLEPCGPYTQFIYANDFRAIFFGLNFETDSSISAVAQVLDSFNIKYKIDGDEYIYPQDPDLVGENTFIGISNRHKKDKDHATMDSLKLVMNGNYTDGLGIEHVNEIQVGYPGNKNLERWKELIQPFDLNKGQVWHLSNSLNIRFVPNKIKEVKGISFKVKSLEKAKKYLSKNNIVFVQNRKNILLDKSGTFGLTIIFE